MTKPLLQSEIVRARRSLQYLNEYAPRVRSRARAWKAAASKLWKDSAQMMRVALTQDDRAIEMRTWAQSRINHCASQDQTTDVTTERRTLEAVLRMLDGVLHRGETLDQVAGHDRRGARVRGRARRLRQPRRRADLRAGTG